MAQIFKLVKTQDLTFTKSTALMDNIHYRYRLRKAL